MGGGASRRAPKDDAPAAGRSEKKKKKSKDPRVILDRLIEAGDDEEVGRMLKEHPNLKNDALDSDGMRALMIACRSGQVDIVKRLLKLDAFLNQRNEVTHRAEVPAVGAPRRASRMCLID